MSSPVHEFSDDGGSEEQQTNLQVVDQNNPAGLMSSQPEMAPSSAGYMMTQNQLGLGHITGPMTYPYDHYYGGVVSAYGGQIPIHPQMMGVHHPGIPLAIDSVEEPVYVNAKQYHGILRRRQSRAKAESDNKLIKIRKPYLHESRHLHAVRRARGCGGRFLNIKTQDNQESEKSNIPSKGKPLQACNSSSPGLSTLEYLQAVSKESCSQVLNLENLCFDGEHATSE